MPRDGRFIERVGTYNPMLPQEHPERIKLNDERIKHWLGVGAKPSDRVARFLGQAEIIPLPEIRETPKKSAPRAKAQERIREAEEAAKAAAEAAAKTEEAAVEEPEAEEAPAEVVVEEEPPAEETSAEGAAAGDSSEEKEKKED